jgi:hypothetical protein
MLGREVVERQQSFAIFGQALGGSSRHQDHTPFKGIDAYFTTLCAFSARLSHI